MEANSYRSSGFPCAVSLKPNAPLVEFIVPQFSIERSFYNCSQKTTHTPLNGTSASKIETFFEWWILLILSDFRTYADRVTKFHLVESVCHFPL